MPVFESPPAPTPQRQPSFVGLPPISPGPEFGSALGISAADLDGPNRAVSPPGHLQGPSPHPYYLNGGGNRIANAIFNNADCPQSTATRPHADDSRNGAHPGPAPGASPLASPAMNYELQSPSPHPHGTQFMQGPYVMMQSPQIQQPAAHRFPPAGHQFNANGAGSSNPNIMHHHHHHDNQLGPSQPGYPAQKGPVSYQQFQSSSPPPGMPSPSLMSNGQFNLPPGWKIEQSQLQQPLSSPRHRPSPSISSLRQQGQAYEIDKETGAQSTRSVSPPTHSPTDPRRPGQPALVSSAGPSSQNGDFRPPNAPFMHQTQGAALARSSTNNTQDSHVYDEPEGKRNSSVFSSIRNRLAGNGNDPMAGRPHPSLGLTGDDVSDASIPTDDQARGPSNYFGLHGSRQPNGNGAPFSGQDPGGASFSPSKEKRPFFSRPSGLGVSSSSHQEVSRPATAEGVMGPPVVGFGPGQPKKRFSKITGMLNRDKAENQPSQPLGYSTTQAQRPSFQGQRPPAGALGYSAQMSPYGGPGDNGQLQGLGRPRSSTAGSRPSASNHGRTPSGQGYGPAAPMGAVVEEERGRKPSGGNLLSNIFGKRSDPKNEEQAQQRPPRSPPGLGQPQGLNPQGQMMVVQRPGQPGFFLQAQGQQLSMQGQPVLPPMGQYATLLQDTQRLQQQQQQQQQQYQGQRFPNSHDTLQRQNLAQLGANQQQQASPGISPVTQSSASPLLTTQVPGGAAAPRQQHHMQQGSPLSNPQNGPDQQPPLGVVQVATAVPIRQVGNSPNGNSEQFQTGISPGGQSDSSRQRSASVVNQIDVGGARKPGADLQGTRNRAASQSLGQQHPVHIASLTTPSRQPGNSGSPRNSFQSQPQDRPTYGSQNLANGTAVSPGHIGASFAAQTRRISQGVPAGQQSQNSDQQPAVSAHSSPSATPAPNRDQQVSPPGVPPKNSPAPNPGQGFGSVPTQSWQNTAEQGQSAPMAQQASVYRPSGPQVAAVVQSFSQQQPQSPWSIGRQNGFGQPGSPGQQFVPGHSTPNMMMPSPPQGQRSEKEGTFSKFIKSSKTFVSQISDSQSLNDKPKPEKENKGMKGMMGVFKRPPKEPKQLESGKPPPGGPQWAIQSGQAPSSMQQYGSSQSSQGKPAGQRLPQMQMPPKAQQVMGIGEGEQKIAVDPQEEAPQSQAYGTGQPSPELPRAQQPLATSQPYPDHQIERSSPQKTSPPLAQQQVRTQPQGGRPSISGDASQAPYEMPQQQQQQQLRRPSQPLGQTQPQTPAGVSSNIRASNAKPQITQRAPEPQYAPVPIPQGYAVVHGEGMSAAKPDAMRAPPYTQPLPLPQPGMPYQGVPQQWVYPGMAPGQMPAGLPPPLVQQGWPQYPPYQGTPPPMIMAQHPPPQQHYMQGHHATPFPPLQGQQPPPHMPIQQHLPQPQVDPQVTAAAPGLHQDASQQIVSPSQQAGFAPPQQAVPNNGHQHVRPQPQQQLSPVADASPVIPGPIDKDGQQPFHQPESIESEPAQTPFQAVPRSAFAVVKPQPGQDQLQPQQGSDLTPQRQTSGRSEVSSLTSVPAMNQGDSSTQSSETVHQMQQQAANASPERMVVSPEPAYERPPVTLTDGPPKTESPATSEPAEQDDIYGATPRQSRQVSPVQPKEHHYQQQDSVVHPMDTSPAQEPSGEPESKFAGPLPNRSPEMKPAAKNEQAPPQQGFVVDMPPVMVEPATATTASAPSPSQRVSTLASTLASTSPEEAEPPSPTDSELGRKRGSDGSGNMKGGEGGGAAGATNGVNGGKPVQTSQEIFEEHKRKQLIRDMEEKIALNPTEPDSMMMLGPGGKKKGDEAPLMSATSYPGQEWNPYGDAWIDDDL